MMCIENMIHEDLDSKHLMGKDMDELEKMFPLAIPCRHPDCKLTDFNHAIEMELEHEYETMKKRGMIRIMYKIDQDDMKDGILNNHARNKIFEWWNGEHWVRLKQ